MTDGRVSGFSFGFLFCMIKHDSSISIFFFLFKFEAHICLTRRCDRSLCRGGGRYLLALSCQIKGCHVASLYHRLFYFFYSRPNNIISYLRISAGNLKSSHRDAESLGVIFRDAAWLAIK